MARVVVELTNRCNLRCRHCYDERHASNADLPMTIVDTLVRDGAGCGIDHVSFTGGEPTLHRQFHSIVERVCASGYTFSFVTNGLRFQSVARLVMRHRASFRGVTFSLDGADESTEAAAEAEAPAEAETETETAAETDADAPEAGETEDKSAPEDAEDEEPAESGDSDEDSAA